MPLRLLPLAWALKGAAAFAALAMVLSATPILAAEWPAELFQQQTLFAPPPAASTPQMALVRQRLVLLNSQSLRRAVAPSGLDFSPTRLDRAASLNRKIRIGLFPGVSGTYRRQAVQEAFGG